MSSKLLVLICCNYFYDWQNVHVMKHCDFHCRLICWLKYLVLFSQQFKTHTYSIYYHRKLWKPANILISEVLFKLLIGPIFCQSTNTLNQLFDAALHLAVFDQCPSLWVMTTKRKKHSPLELLESLELGQIVFSGAILVYDKSVFGVNYTTHSFTYA